MSNKVALLLVNLGSPSAPTAKAIRAFLCEFLMDKRVVDLPWLVRWVLVYGVIAPTRPKKLVESYESIWQEAGSPLSVYSKQLQQKVQEGMPEHVQVYLAMRYGAMSIKNAIVQSIEDGAKKILLLPLFPQYAESTTGSVLAKAFELMGQQLRTIPVQYLGDFYDKPFFIDAMAERYRAPLAEFKPDLLVLSYHGLPQAHMQRIDGDRVCQSDKPCPVITDYNQQCYRAQCYATTRALVKALELRDDQYKTVFQSEFGRAKWIGPNIQRLLPELRAKGHRKLALACPSFLSDCLETLEEIGQVLKASWLDLGGEDLLLLPCLNDDKGFANGINRWCLDHLDDLV